MRGGGAPSSIDVDGMLGAGVAAEKSVVYPPGPTWGRPARQGACPPAAAAAPPRSRRAWGRRCARVACRPKPPRRSPATRRGTWRAQGGGNRRGHRDAQAAASPQQRPPETAAAGRRTTAAAGRRTTAAAGRRTTAGRQTTAAGDGGRGRCLTGRGAPPPQLPPQACQGPMRMMGGGGRCLAVDELDIIDETDL